MNPSDTKINRGSFGKRALPDILAVMVMYLVTFALFYNFIISDVRFAPTPDHVTAKTMNTVGRSISEEEGGVATWNPYIFLGMPMYSSLSYYPGHLLNPIGHLVEGINYIWGWDKDRVQKLISWYFLSGIFMYIFARGIGLPVWAALLAGLTILLNPYNISLAEAAHGSKHWSISVLPLVFLFTHWTVTRRRWIDVGLLALSIGTLFLLHHVQIAYYGALFAGFYVLVWAILKFFKDRITAIKGFGLFAAGGLLGLAMSAYQYLPVFVYQKHSIRGMAPLFAKAGTGTGLDWEYATSWSLRPLEALQFLVPGLFGVGGSMSPNRAMTPENITNYNLYWGDMPFTQSNLYMGIIPLVLAIIGAVYFWKRSDVVRWMTIASLVALVASFGKYLPIIYGPMYYLLPMFDKFRIPSMILVVMTIGVAVLAAYGLMGLVKFIRKSEDAPGSEKGFRILFGSLAGLSLLGILVAAVGGNGPSVESGWFIRAQEVQAYGRQAQALISLRYAMFTKSLMTASLILGLFSGTALLFTRWRDSGKMIAAAFVTIVILLTTVDLFQLDRRFMHTYPARKTFSSLDVRPTVTWLQAKQKELGEPFRILPLGNQYQNDYWMYHRIQSVGGYSAVKTRVYQDLADYALGISKGMPNLKVAGLMNARFIVSAQELPGIIEKQYTEPGGGLFVYRNPFVLPRAWFVDSVEEVTDLQEAMNRISSEDFDPRSTAIVNQSVDFTIGGPDTLSKAVVPANAYHAKSMEIEASTPDTGFLVVSELWYPDGWRATIDGVPTQIYRTDYGFRGLVVPAGQHHIRMEISLAEVRAGFWISGISLFAIAGLLGWSGWRELRRHPKGDASA